MRTDTIDTFFRFNLKLTMSAYMDLVIERKGDITLVRTEICSPVRIELWCGDTICAFCKDGKRMIYPDRMKEFRAFQECSQGISGKGGWRMGRRFD